MLFNRFVGSARKNLTKYAVNDLTYEHLLDAAHTENYSLVCKKSDHEILIDILVAALHNKPLIISPKYGELPPLEDIDESKFGIYMCSSGSSGNKKLIYLPESMLAANVRSAVSAQKLSEKDKVLTVCSLNHTGGLNAQTLAAIMIGASVTVKKFNPYSFFKDLEGHTVTHLIPVMIDSLTKIKNIQSPKALRLVVAGSDCVNQHHVRFWQSLKIPFMINYGLTEAGPIIINHLFHPQESTDIFKIGVPLGTTAWCDVEIIDGVLQLKGDNINSEQWLDTGDCVDFINDWFIYRGRKSAGCKIIPKNYK